MAGHGLEEHEEQDVPREEDGGQRGCFWEALFPTVSPRWRAEYSLPGIASLNPRPQAR